jgi:hypothetical protein
LEQLALEKAKMEEVPGHLPNTPDVHGGAPVSLQNPLWYVRRRYVIFTGHGPSFGHERCFRGNREYEISLFVLEDIRKAHSSMVCLDVAVFVWRYWRFTLVH